VSEKRLFGTGFNRINFSCKSTNLRCGGMLFTCIWSAVICVGWVPEAVMNFKAYWSHDAPPV